MGSISRELKFWFEQLEEPDPKKRIQAINNLIEKKHPKIAEILIDIAETEKSEEVRINAIQALGKFGFSGVFDTLKKLLIGESEGVRKTAIRTIVDLGDISAIRYLTRYYYSSYSEGVKPDVKIAINDLLYILDKEKQKNRPEVPQIKKIQEKVIEKTPRSEKDFDYKKYIKKFFD